jgi:Amiloride-sensitive sodium channel
MSERKKRSSDRLRAKVRRFSARKFTSSVGKGLENIVEFIGELNKRGKLHGIDHLVNKNYHPLERFLWLSLVLAAFYGVFFIGNTQFERYRANPTVISLERGTLPVQP